MDLGHVDLAPLEYMIVYKRDGLLNTWTLGASAFKVNYGQMKADEGTEIIAVYKKQSVEDILDIFIS